MMYARFLAKTSDVFFFRISIIKSTPQKILIGCLIDQKKFLFFILNYLSVTNTESHRE